MPKTHPQIYMFYKQNPFVIYYENVCNKTLKCSKFIKSEREYLQLMQNNFFYNRNNGLIIKLTIENLKLL